MTFSLEEILGYFIAFKRIYISNITNIFNYIEFIFQ